MIYFIFGKDTFQSKQKLKELIKKYSDFELLKINAEKIKINELISKFNSVSLLSPKRLLIIENLSQNSEQKEVVEFLKNANSANKYSNDANDILIFYEDKVDKKTSLYKFLNKLTSAKAGEKIKFEFSELNNFELKKWAQEYIEKNPEYSGARIEPVALEKLLINAKPNLWQLSNELDKLLAFDKNITLENAQKLTAANFDDNIFNLADAIGNGDKATALELINKQLESGIEPLYLLSMIARQFRILIQIKDATQNQNYPNYSLIAKEIGLHPFVVQKSISQTQKYSFEELENKFKKILQLDLDLKSSKLSPEILFTRFVAT